LSRHPRFTPVVLEGVAPVRASGHNYFHAAPPQCLSECARSSRRDDAALAASARPQQDGNYHHCTATAAQVRFFPDDHPDGFMQ
jgi:hypothetical protein